jgi:hypothetical protein
MLAKPKATDMACVTARGDRTLPGDLTSRICFVAIWAHDHDYADVAAWMQRCLSADIRTARGTRRRGVRVKLARINREIVLDATRVSELTKGE